MNWRGWIYCSMPSGKDWTTCAKLPLVHSACYAMAVPTVNISKQALMINFSLIFLLLYPRPHPMDFCCDRQKQRLTIEHMPAIGNRFERNPMR